MDLIIALTADRLLILRIWREWKMFETSIFCDKCGCGFSFPNVEPKWFMTKIAREKGWTIGKRHLCPDCNNKNRRTGEQNERNIIPCKAER